MEMHWRDVLDLKEAWSYLEIVVPEEANPSLRLQSGGQLRFKLQSARGPLFWGNISKDYYGVWLLRNDNQWSLDQMPVLPIQSADVEKAMVFSGTDRDSFWARYFAKALTSSNANPLTKGKWLISNKRQQIDRYPYDLTHQTADGAAKLGYYTSRPAYLDWGIAGSYAVAALKTMPNENEGRVKWWRKKVRNGSCPPILIWFISCLQAYVVLDGHVRLFAHALEQKKPDYMVLKSLNEYSRGGTSPEHSQQILESLEARQNHRWKSPMTVEEVNKLLINVFDNRPFVSHTSSSLAIKDMETIWLEEVREFADQYEVDHAELSAMIEGY